MLITVKLVTVRWAWLTWLISETQSVRWSQVKLAGHTIDRSSFSQTCWKMCEQIQTFAVCNVSLIWCFIIPVPSKLCILWRTKVYRGLVRLTWSAFSLRATMFYSEWCILTAVTVVAGHATDEDRLLSPIRLCVHGTAHVPDVVEHNWRRPPSESKMTVVGEVRRCRAMLEDKSGALETDPLVSWQPVELLDHLSDVIT